MYRVLQFLEIIQIKLHEIRIHEAMMKQARGVIKSIMEPLEPYWIRSRLDHDKIQRKILNSLKECNLYNL